MPFSNEQTIVLPQIETMEAVKNLDSLLRVEGVDGYFVGPRDLSMSMGFPDGPAHEEVRSLMLPSCLCVGETPRRVSIVASGSRFDAIITATGGHAPGSVPAR